MGRPGTCGDCGARTSTVRSQRCRACWKVATRSTVPPDRECLQCGGTLTMRQMRFCSLACKGAYYSGPRNVLFNGGLSTSTDGRTLIVHRDGSYSLYARALMEAHIGHRLTFNEVVHHINGDCTDDRIENLQVLTRAEHIEIHRADLLAGRARKAAA